MDPVTVGAVGVATGVGVAAISKHADDAQNEFLRDILAQLVAANRYAAVERERTIIPINITVGYFARQPLRVHSFILSGAPGDEVAIKVGTANVISFVNVTGDPHVIPVPMRVVGDVSAVDITTPASTAYRAYMLAYDPRDVDTEYQR